MEDCQKNVTTPVGDALYSQFGLSLAIEEKDKSALSSRQLVIFVFSLLQNLKSVTSINSDQEFHEAQIAKGFATFVDVYGTTDFQANALAYWLQKCREDGIWNRLSFSVAHSN